MLHTTAGSIHFDSVKAFEMIRLPYNSQSCIVECKKARIFCGGIKEDLSNDKNNKNRWLAWKIDASFCLNLVQGDIYM